ncbi:hypothetical protein OROMI_030842 [Orobanche minor]
MGSTNESPNIETFDNYTCKYAPFPSLLSAPTQVESRENRDKSSEEGVNYHQRCSSESFLIEEQPSWLDDLLNDTETTFHRGHHRRWASDSYAYLEEAAKSFTLEEKSKYVSSSFVATSMRTQNLMHLRDVEGTYDETKADYLLAKKYNQESEEVVSSLAAAEHSRGETSSQNLEDSADKATGSQVKPSGPKADTKRFKQHNAHRSRVRKLQYIAHLERTVQILKAEGSEVGAELEFLEQQNIILTMENRALRQRLESVSQEQIIKHWEQGMLEREIGRLQNLYHMQKQKQMQMQNQQQPYSKHRRNKSKDLDHQLNTAPVKNKDATSSKGSSVSGAFRV